MAPPLSLFLIGKTGHGKSSTGNSLLGRDAFTVCDTAASVTTEVQVGTITREDGRDLVVVDGPGLGDTRMNSVEAMRKTYQDMSQGIHACSNGIAAFLIVLKYGNRFTEEEKTTIDSMKTILGDSVVKDHCIIVFTHGEVFDMSSNRAAGSTFEDWLSQQTGELKNLISEAGQRCVLAYNVDTGKMDSSITKLLEHAEGLVSSNGLYTSDNYRTNETQREQLLVRLDAPRLQQMFDSEIGAKSTALSQIQGNGQGHDSQLASLAALASEVTQLSQRITAEDRDTGVLSSQKQSCDSLISSVRSQEGVVSQAKANEAERLRLEAIRAEQARVDAARAQARSGSKGGIKIFGKKIRF